MSYAEWTDAEGTRAVILDGHLSIYGKPSMTRDDGEIAIGVDLQVTDQMVERAAVAMHAAYQPDEGDDLDECWTRAIRAALEAAVLR